MIATPHVCNYVECNNSIWNRFEIIHKPFDSTWIYMQSLQTFLSYLIIKWFIILIWHAL